MIRWRNTTTGRILAENKIARHLVLYESLGAFVITAFQFPEVIARKSLGASKLEITLMSILPPAVQLLSIWTGRWLAGRDQRKTIAAAGFISVLAIASGFYLTSVTHLLIMLTLFFMVNNIPLVGVNRVYHQYIPDKLGNLFGISRSLQTLIAAICAAFAGLWLDHVQQGWQAMFLTAALLSIPGIWLLATIPTKVDSRPEPGHLREWLMQPWKDVFDLLNRRRDFLRFEGAFMIYGFAFMMMLPVVPIYLVDVLQLSYAEIGFTRGTILSLVMVLGIPIFGRWFDRTTPHTMAASVFAMGTLYPFLLLTAQYMSGAWKLLMVQLAFVVFGIVMSGVTIVWNLGSIRFAGDNEDAGVYHSVHVAATGLRGCVAPLLGYAFMAWLGISAAMIASSIAWLLSSITMIAAKRRAESA